ncbi:ATP-binding protein [Actinomyces sp. 2119]|uniref:ATP-binding protein n=1 Tax=Actinomyces sp. 2119 TaxID=2321393 RepID=UPI000E6C30C3|nr:ATP-binding protein [Actinomyces sp. 2119]RJF42441.1 ATP-binding protein [Actinomyces sp. 2119]
MTPVNLPIQEALPDIPRLWTALAEWGACLLYVLVARGQQDRPARAVVVVAVIVAALPALCAYHLGAGSLPTTLWLPGMVGAVALMWLVLHLALGGPVRRCAYLVVRAFVLAELVASLQWQLSLFLSESFLPQRLLPEIPQADPAALTLLLVLDTLLLALVYPLERGRGHGRVVPTSRFLVLSAAIAAITFAMSNLSFMTTSTPFSARLGAEIFYVRTLVDLCGFVVLYAQLEQDREAQAAREVVAVRALLHSQHDQYLASKRVTDVVNRRYHDLRNLVTAIRAETDPGLRRDQLDELEDSVRPYGAHYRTGNPVLDVILTDKGQACVEHGITLTAMADGAAVGFISTVDLATIVGNALDNAVEACAQVGDADRRLVRLDLRAHHGLVLLEVENTFATPPVFSADGSELVTSKEDATAHGFGVTSIRHAAAGYGGEVTVGVTQEDTFVLRVLLPVPSSARRR